MEGGRRPRDVHPLGTIHHLLRLLERADQTVVFEINENDSLPPLCVLEFPHAKPCLLP